MSTTLEILARSLHVCEKVDVSTFQRRARILQSIWREDNGFECGEHVRGDICRPLGSRLVMPWAEKTLENFLTQTVRDVVRREVCDGEVACDKLFGRPRIFNDLLSSQPLCFNLFAELRFNLELASMVVSELTGKRFARIKEIRFEHSPGRGDSRYTGDRSAFDVFLECETSSGGRGFVGIEVKYHENLQDKAARTNARHHEIADFMGCFPESRSRLEVKPLQQIWRDHLLAGITKIVDGYDDGMFVMLYPQDNCHCQDAIVEYQKCLSDSSSFAEWTMEEFTGLLKSYGNAPWIDSFIDRYLAFEKIDVRMERLKNAG